MLVPQPCGPSLWRQRFRQTLPLHDSLAMASSLSFVATFSSPSNPSNARVCSSTSWQTATFTTPSPAPVFYCSACSCAPSSFFRCMMSWRMAMALVFIIPITLPQLLACQSSRYHSLGYSLPRIVSIWLQHVLQPLYFSSQVLVCCALLSPRQHPLA